MWKWFGKWSKGRGRKKHNSPPLSRKFAVPRLEPLEERDLPATWTGIGPAPQGDTQGWLAGPNEADSGRITSIAISGSTMYVGEAGGGLWSSNNFTAANPTWTPLTDSQGLINANTGLGSGTIDVGAIATANVGNSIYVGTGEANYSLDSRYGSGILVSQNGGSTWNLYTGTAASPTAFFKHSISKIIVDPTDTTGMTLYMAVVPAAENSATTDDGIYSSTNGGQTWNLVSGGIGSTIVVTDLEYTETGTSLTLIAGVGVVDNQNGKSGIWTGTPAGGTVTWTAAKGLPATALGRVSLASDHTINSKDVYAAISNPDKSLNGVYKSADNGANWTNIWPTATPSFVGTQGTYDLGIGLSPAGPALRGRRELPALRHLRRLQLHDHLAGDRRRPQQHHAAHGRSRLRLHLGRHRLHGH
jgi:hypothetical protein